MAENKTIPQKKEHARLLYTREGVTVMRELAARAGITEKTAAKWVELYGWEKQRSSLIVTKDEELSRLYEQLTELNDLIRSRPKGERYANSKEADTLVKLTSAIRSLETDVSVGESIQVCKGLIGMVTPESLTDAKMITKWADIYIKSLLR